MLMLMLLLLPLFSLNHHFHCHHRRHTGSHGSLSVPLLCKTILLTRHLHRKSPIKSSFSQSQRGIPTLRYYTETLIRPEVFAAAYVHSDPPSTQPDLPNAKKGQVLRVLIVNKRNEVATVRLMMLRM